MATAVPPTRPAIQSVLERLRGRVKRYILLEGISLVLIVAGLLFWLSFGLDWSWFQISKLELPKWFRQVFLIAAICMIVAGCLMWIVFRLMREMKARALALVLERRFPELDDRLITAVETAEESTENRTELTQAMLDRTIDGVSEASEKLHVGEAFNKGPLRRSVLLAVVLVTSVIAFCTTNASAFDRWKRAFIGWDDVYWNRDTDLIAKVEVPPNGELKEFIDGDTLVYKHPRGADLDLRVFVTDGTKDPEEVELYYRRDDGKGEAEVPMTRVDGGLYKQKIANVRASLEFWITGGDFTNRKAYRVEVVDPPEVKQTVLLNKFPAYTGFNDDPAMRRQRLRTFDHSLLLGTMFELNLMANKPLIGALIETSSYRINLERGKKGTLSYMLPGDTEPTEVSLPVEMVDTVLREKDDDKTFRAGLKSESDTKSGNPESKHLIRVPFVLVPANEAVRRLQQWSTDAWREPFPISEEAGEPIRVFLHDTDDIVSRDPYRLLVRSIADEIPDVQTRLIAVRNKITRLAKIPVAGVITDDLSIREVRFDWQSVAKDADDPNAGQRWKREPFDYPFTLKSRRYEIGETADGESLPPGSETDGPVTREFAVAPLNLEVGQRLFLVVTAEDRKPQPGRGDVQEFEIVTKDELLGLIYQDELKLLQQFRDVITKVQRVHDEYVANEIVMNEAIKMRSEMPEDGYEDEKAKRLKRLNDLFLGTIEAGLHDLRTGSGESLTVEVSLRDLVREMQNNLVDDPAVIDRMESRLFAPLSRINGTFKKINKDDAGLFEQADRSAGRLKFAQEEVIADPAAGEPDAQLADAVQDLDRLLSEMKDVLAEMEELIKYNNAVKTLQAILKAQEDLKKATQDKQIDDLGGLGDLLD